MSYPPYMPSYRPRRSFAGPLLLVALGVLLLLANMHVIRWSNLGWWFSRWWPLLLIFVGVLKLLEWVSFRSDTPRAGRLGGGLVVLLVFLSLAGYSAYKAHHVNWEAVHEQLEVDPDLQPIFGERHEFTERIERALPPGAQVRIDDGRGDVKITASSDDRVHVTVRKQVYAHSNEEAQRIAGDVKPSVALDGRTLALSAGRFDRGSVDLDVQVPRTAALAVSDGKGDVTVAGLDAGVTVEDQHGDVALNDVAGPARITLRKGSVTANKIAGDLALDGNIDDVNVSNVGGAVTLQGEFFGDTKLEHVAKGVQFRSSRTELSAAKLDGSLQMDTGDLRVTDAAGPFTVRTRAKDIRLDEVNGAIHVDDANGDVELHAKAPLGPMDVNNNRGQIRLYLPPNAGFQLDARAQRGEIESDFLEGQSGASEGTLNGTVGKGGPEIKLNTFGSTIEIRKS